MRRKRSSTRNAVSASSPSFVCSQPEKSTHDLWDLWFWFKDGSVVILQEQNSQVRQRSSSRRRIKNISTIRLGLSRDTLEDITAECTFTTTLRDKVISSLSRIRMMKLDKSWLITIKLNKPGSPSKTKSKPDQNSRILSKTFIIWSQQAQSPEYITLPTANLNQTHLESTSRLT